MSFNFNAYESLLQSIFTRKRTTTTRHLNEFIAFLEQNLLPEISYPIIQIIGTNGKGSTASFLESMLHLNGYKTGMFSSPHLHRFEERFRINRQNVMKKRLAPALHEVLKMEAKNRQNFPFFDIATALGIHLFNKEKIDIAIVEAGMGGKRDATTALPIQCVILTSIGLDHQQWLGQDEETITKEKIGAFKPNQQIISGVKKPHLIKLLEQAIHHQASSKIWQIDRDFFVRMKKNTPRTFSYEQNVNNKEIQVDNIELTLQGDFQRTNFSLAVSAFYYINSCVFKRDFSLLRFENLLQESARQTKWPGRMQKCEQGGRNILLDGAHNPEAIQALQRNLTKDPFHLIFACSNDKPISALLSPLLELKQCKSVCFCLFSQDRATKHQKLEAAMSSLKQSELIPSYRANTVKEGIALAAKKKKKNEYLLITGSLFIVSEALKALEKDSEKETSGKVQS